MILALIQAGIALAIGFGLNMTTEQMSLILTFTGILLGVITRSQVVPTDKIPPRTLHNIEEKDK